MYVQLLKLNIDQPQSTVLIICINLNNNGTQDHGFFFLLIEIWI